MLEGTDKKDTKIFGMCSRSRDRFRSYHRASDNDIEICWCFILQDDIFFGREVLCLHFSYLPKSKIESHLKVSFDE